MTFRALASPVSAAVRLRGLLRVALRRFRLRCVKAEGAAGAE